jgi:hypothetical protein
MAIGAAVRRVECTGVSIEAAVHPVQRTLASIGAPGEWGQTVAVVVR